MSVQTMQMAKMSTINFVMTSIDSHSSRREVQAHGEFECNFPPQSISNLNMLPQHGGRKNFQLKIFLYLKKKRLEKPFQGSLGS